jgi:hypothetical protein
VDEAELARLGRTLHGLLEEYSAHWRNVRSPVPADAPSYERDLRALGWLPPVLFADVAREVVVRDILDPLETIGITITKDERAALLA